MPARLPTVAVIMSTYRGDNADWLRRACFSVRDQEYPKDLINLYIARDGTVPHSLEDALDEQSSRGATVVRLPHNVGLASALNACLSRLSNESYIFRMDADDICLNNRMSKQVDYLERHGDVAILGGAIEEFDARGPMGIRRYPNREHVRRYICLASPLAHPTVCFRRSAIDALQSYANVPYNEDIHMWFRALALGLVIDNLPDVILRYRRSEGFSRRRGREKALAEWACYTAGIVKLHGISWRLLLPCARLASRFMPPRWIDWVYGSSPVRRFVLNR